jgi:hypothetical protein
MTTINTIEAIEIAIRYSKENHVHGFFAISQNGYLIRCVDHQAADKANLRYIIHVDIHGKATLY